MGWAGMGPGMGGYAREGERREGMEGLDLV